MKYQQYFWRIFLENIPHIFGLSDACGLGFASYSVSKNIVVHSEGVGMDGPCDFKNLSPTVSLWQLGNTNDIHSLCLLDCLVIVNQLK